MSDKSQSKVVAHLFVKKYYTTLCSNPENLSQLFYSTDSTYSRGISDSEVHTVVGSEKIGEYFSTLKHSTVEILVIDEQSSLSGSVIVMVTGLVKTENQPSRTFVETFFLAENNRSYYVLNNIFRFVGSGQESEESTNEAPLESSPHQESVEQREDQSKDNNNNNTNNQEAAEVQKEVLRAEPETKVEKIEEKSVDVQVEKVEKELAVPDVQSKQVEVIPKPTTQTITRIENRTYASILMKESASKTSSVPPSDNSSAAAVPPSNPPKQNGIKSNNTNVAGSANGSSSPNKLKNNNYTKRNDKNFTRQNDKHTIFVKGLNSSVQKVEVEEAFRAFGSVKSFRLQKNEKTGYVEFTTYEAFQKAMNHKNPILIKGLEISIEPKRPSSPSRSVEQKNNNNGVYRQFNRETQ